MKADATRGHSAAIRAIRDTTGHSAGHSGHHTYSPVPSLQLVAFGFRPGRRGRNTCQKCVGSLMTKLCLLSGGPQQVSSLGFREQLRNEVGEVFDAVYGPHKAPAID